MHDPSSGIQPARILVGLAGWTYPDWKALVYPRANPFDKLRYLSEYFSTIEINTTFYAIPEGRVVEGWLRSVEDNRDFVFTAKLYKEFTHGQDTRHGRPLVRDETVAAFKAAFQPMLAHGRLGALLLQFPYRYHDQPKNRDYLLKLLDHFQEFPLVVEVRHKSFDQPSFYELLTARDVAFANIDQPTVSDSMPHTRVFTSRTRAYLRFHGRNAQAWFAPEVGRDARYDYQYSSEELESYLGMIQEFRHRQGTLYVIFNNHYRAAEVKNALEFIHLITGQPVRVMPPLLKAYPDLQRIALTEGLRRERVGPGENYTLFE